MLGYMYEKGIGVDQDTGQALLWYRSAAAKADPTAQSLVGRAYNLGLGVSANQNEAMSWFRKSVDTELSAFASRPILFAGGALGALKAAESGNYLAEIIVGKMYLTGHGVEQSDKAAAQWLTKAAARGFGGQPDAALLLQDGRGGLPQDPAEALRLYRQGSEVAVASIANSLRHLCLTMGRQADCRAGP
jgi:TPR repeat protein